MKIKILEHNNSGTPKFKYFGIRSILEVDIKDKLKFIILPVNVGGVNIPWGGGYVPSIPPDMLFFHDSSPGTRIGDYNYVADRKPYQPHIDRGSQYMFWLQMSDPYYATGKPGFTSASPFDYFSADTVLGWKAALEAQGANFTTKGYCYINWTEDNRQFLQFNGYTGPPGFIGGVYRTLDDYDKMQKAWAKHFKGGIDPNTGQQIQGLRDHFPGISFGIYNIPQWWYGGGDGMWVTDYDTVMNDIDTVAQILVDRAPDLWDAIQLLMPSLYSVVNNAVVHRCQAAQATILCKKINEKLIAKGKTPLQIIPYVTGFYWTTHTGSPYSTNKYGTSTNSFCAKKYGIYNVTMNYTPPFTRMLEKDSVYEQYEPLIQEGADGAIFWLGQGVRLREIVGRTLNCPLPCAEDEVASGPMLNPDGSPKLDANGKLQWRNGWFKGITGNPAVWGLKDMWRQAISADLNYQAGVCMGITGNRWWWKELKGSTQYTPTEWLPLQGRERFGYPNQPLGASGMSKSVTNQSIDDYLTGVVASNIEIWKKTWLRIKYGKK